LIEPIIERVALAEIPGSPGTVTARPFSFPGRSTTALAPLLQSDDELNEQLVAGREDVFYRWQLDAAAKKLPDDVINYYVRALSNPDSLRGNFGWYRALNTTIAQDQQRKTRWLTMPVLAIGGEKSFGEHVAAAAASWRDRAA
jgi:hypothetical protein